MTNVTKTYIPDRNKYQQYIDRIFSSGWLTNNGQFVQELTAKLSAYLGVENLLLVSNGTLALQVAYKVFNLKGDVLTTPFTFAATASSIVWEGLNPLFVDIEPDTLNLDWRKMEEKITDQTTGIVPVHVFGNPCELSEIQRIATKFNLKVIYDAAHAFGIKHKNESIANYGDASTFSFHSTKVFHTIEGGAIIFREKRDLEKAKLMINFGIPYYDQVTELGINCKMNEFQAAMGLCVLDDLEEIIQKREKVYSIYKNAFQNINKVALQKLNKDWTQNYSYFPILFESENKLLEIKEKLNKQEIFPRRYFYPSLESLPYLKIKQEVDISTSVSKRILCLPLFESLDLNIQNQIINIILTNL